MLAASLRNPMHTVTAAKLGCEVATVPGKVLRQMLDHPRLNPELTKIRRCVRNA